MVRQLRRLRIFGQRDKLINHLAGGRTQNLVGHRIYRINTIRPIGNWATTNPGCRTLPVQLLHARADHREIVGAAGAGHGFLPFALSRAWFVERRSTIQKIGVIWP
jgi:hypothetical protein